MSEGINKPNEDETAEVSAEDLRKVVGGFVSVEHGTQPAVSSAEKGVDERPASPAPMIYLFFFLCRGSCWLVLNGTPISLTPSPRRCGLRM